jgi:putative alpha-1,2-mannosidase
MIKSALLVTLIISSNLFSQEKESIDYVDPLLGTSSSRWMLFPGPALPFGMVKLSPDNSDIFGIMPDSRAQPSILA